MAMIQSPYGGHCSSCLRKWARQLDLRPFHQQIRGKKKLAQPATTVKVRLLEDVPKFGRQGAIIPVAAGRMRNYWYPKKMAEYVTVVELKQLNLQNATFERDFNFELAENAVEGEETPSAQEEEVQKVPVDLALLSPQKSMQLLSTYLPPKLEFYRTPILAARENPELKRATAAVSSAAADLSAASEPRLSKPEPVQIYGSVSTADIATGIKTLLANHPECSRIVLMEEDISFETRDEVSGVEVDRVKRLGEFGISIKSKGAFGSLRRTIVVNAQQDHAQEISR
ncbi:MAG: hypothetical protein M1816_003570 [Peltula sp. TS41687]|nr:MAG: hypothetical protein M1816_003570 [Peltula sp. TS41687]